MRRNKNSNLDASRQRIFLEQSQAAGTLGGGSELENTNFFDDKSLLDLSYTLFEQDEDEDDDVPIDYDYG